MDSRRLKEVCDNNENSFSVNFSFIESMGLNEVLSVDNSCMVLCYANEFLKIIEDSDGRLKRTVFSDNVRDFQGDSVINCEIKETIDSDPEKFVLLNNGITIVCDRFTQKNRSIMLTNPQIVNGCQSSTVLHFSKKRDIDVCAVPMLVKIIATTDLDVTNQIVKGTNRQNIVYDESFEITRLFHKYLEEYFEISEFNGRKYYYERRSRQFQHNSNIKQYQKISFKNLIQASVAVLLGRPDKAHNHESKLIKEFQNKIFIDSHSYMPYYVAAVMNSYVEYFLRNSGSSNGKYKPYKFHILAIMKALAGNEKINIENSKESEKFYGSIVSKMNSDDLLMKALACFDSCQRIWIVERKQSKFAMKDREDFVELLFENAHNSYGLNADKDVYYGDVVKVLVDRYGSYYGYVSHSPSPLFFHQKKNKGIDIKNSLGKRVMFKKCRDDLAGKEIASEVVLA